MTYLQKKLVLLALALVAADGALAEPVKTIRVRNAGPGAADEQFVRAHISIKEGDEIVPAVISGDIRNLLATERFSDVRAETDTVDGQLVVTYVVSNKLRLVGKVKVTGAKHFSVEKVRDLLGLNPGQLIDDSVLAVAGHKVEEAYGDDNYPKAGLTWSMDVTDQKVGLATASLVISEGRKASVQGFAFTGNSRVPSKLLRQAAGQPGLLSFSRWFGTMKYDADGLEDTRMAIRAACMSRGFLDVEVGAPELTERSHGKYVITFAIREGPLHRLGKASLSGVTLFPEAELTALIKMTPGAPLSASEVEFTAGALRQYYTGRGYLRTSVKSSISPRPSGSGGGTVDDVVFVISEGTLVHVRNVYVRGNTVTRENVIRRELTVFPGDTFDEKQIRRSETRLRNLGFFSRVSTSPQPTSKPGENDLMFDVEEGRTGSFQIGGGYSSVDGLIGYAEISEGNFDIAAWPPKGAGQKLRLRGQNGQKTELIGLSFVEPWFMGRRLSLGLDVLSSRTENDDYAERKTGGSVSIGKALGFFFDRADLTYGIERREITSVADTNAYVKFMEDGTETPYYFTYASALKSSLTLGLVRETRDNPFFPSRGHRLRISGFVAGGTLGGDTEIYGEEVKAEKYFELWFGHVLCVRGRVEVTDEYGDTDEMSITDKLFAGGGRTIRGFGYRSVGPKVSRTLGEGGETEYRPIGGRTMAYGSVEYVVPLVEKLKLAAFLDSGDVQEEAYDFDFGRVATSAGLELRLDVQQFPIRFSYSWILQKDDESTQEEPWGFWIGSGF